MRYQRVRWLHDSPEYPVVLYSEIDDEGWEVRKVDEYADGRRDTASKERETGRTFLGVVPVPPLEEIDASPEFEATAITAAQFEIVWRQATSALDLR